MTHLCFKAEFQRELKESQKPISSPETQNLSAYFPFSTDGELSLVGLRFPPSFPDACTAVTRCRMNACSVASTHICRPADSQAYLRPTGTLIFFSFTAQTVCFLHLCSPPPSSVTLVHDCRPHGASVHVPLQAFATELLSDKHLAHSVQKAMALAIFFSWFSLLSFHRCLSEVFTWGLARPSGSQDLPCEKQGVNHR